MGRGRRRRERFPKLGRVRGVRAPSPLKRASLFEPGILSPRRMAAFLDRYAKQQDALAEREPSPRPPPKPPRASPRPSPASGSLWSWLRDLFRR